MDNDPLAAARVATLATITALERQIADIVLASETDNADDEHDPEGATIAFERAQAVSLLSVTRARLDAIEVALLRVTAGSYADCERCGKPIGVERLAARPSTTLCIDCAR